MFRSVSVVLSANSTTFVTSMRTAGAAMDDFHRKAESGAAKSEAAANRMHKALMGIAVVAATVLAAGLMSSVKAAAQFEVAMRNVSTLSVEVRNNFLAAGKAVIDLSTTLPQSARVLAEGLYEIASSGFQGAAGMEVLEQSAKAASAGLTTTDIAAKGITAVLNAYGKSASEAADVSDILFQTVNLGVVRFEELSHQIGDFVGTAAQLGVPIEDAAAAFAAMTLSGISAAESATSINRVMVSFIKPSETMTAVLKANNIESGVAAVETLGLKGAMELLNKATGGSVTALSEMFPEIRGLRGALALLAAEGDNYTRSADGIADATNRAGATQKALDEQMKAASAQWTIFKNRIDAGRIALGTSLLPVLISVMEGMTALGQDAAPALESAMAALAPMFSDLGDAGSDLLAILADMGPGIATFVGFLGTIAGTAAVGSLTAIAASLSAVTRFAEDHSDVLTAIAIIYGTRLATGIALATAQLVLWRASAIASTIASSGLALALQHQVHYFGLVGLAIRAVPYVAIIATIGAAINGIQNARRQAGELSKDLKEGLDLTTAGGLQTYLDQIASKKDALREVTNEGNRFTRFLRSVVELATPLPNTLADAAEAFKRLGMDEIAAGKAAVSLSENVNTIRHATGATEQTVLQLAKAMGIDLTGAFGKSAPERQKIIDNLKDVRSNAYGAGSGMKAMANETYEAAKAASDAVDELAGNVRDAFTSGFDLISSFGDATKEHASALEAEASAADKAADAQDRVSQAGERAADAQSKIADAQDRAIDAQDAVIEAQEQVAESETDLAEMRVDLAERAIEAQEAYARRVVETNERVVEAEAEVLEARERVVDAEQKVAEMRTDFAERAAEAQERYAEKVEDSNDDILQAEEDLADRRIDLAQKVADAQRRLEDDRLEGQERIAAAEKNIRDVQKRSADEARERRQADADRRRLDSARTPEERRRIQDQIDARKAREDDIKGRTQAAADLKEAQADLAKARQEAAETEEKNRLALAKAQEDQAEGIQDAEEKVTEARERGIEIQREASKLAKQQVEDEKQIAEAVEGIEDARKGVLDAEKAAGEARREVITVQKEGRELARQQADDEKAIADAVERVADARRGVLDAQKSTADATKDIARAQADAARAAGDVGEAQDEAAKAYDELAKAQQKVKDTSLEGFFDREVQKAKAFAEGIREAARQGLDPDFIAQLMQEGPEKAAPILDAIMADQTGTLTRQMNAARDGLAVVQEQMVEAARVTQRAINATNTDMAAEYGKAMEILEAKAALGGKATGEAIARELGMKVADVERIAKDYVIVLAAGINPLLTAIGSPPVQLDQVEGGRVAGVSKFAFGGTVPGSGDRDSVPAMLTPGEYVFSKPAVKRIGVENLEREHQRARRGYAEGGFVYPTDVPPTPNFGDYGTTLGHSADESMKKLHDDVARFLAKHPPKTTGPSSGGGRGSNYGFQALIDFLNMRGIEHEVTSTTGGKHAEGSRHYGGWAADFWSNNMAEIGDAFMSVSASMNELIHNPGYSVDSGRVVDPSFWGSGTWEGHAGHVHAATHSGPDEGPGLPGPNDRGDGEAAGDIRDWISQAMRITGVGEDWREPLYRRAMFESGGRNIPQGIHDINTDLGTPAYGPFQVIEPTFNAHKMDGYDDWHNPVHNAIAAIRYIQSRYGSIHEIDPPTQGYAKGGIVEMLSKLPAFHSGGIVPGDKDVIARLEGGEGILSRSAMGSAPLGDQINTAISTALNRYGNINPLSGGPAVTIDYARIGEEVASAFVRAGIKVEADGRTLGTLAREDGRRARKVRL